MFPSPCEVGIASAAPCYSRCAITVSVPLRGRDRVGKRAQIPAGAQTQFCNPVYIVYHNQAAERNPFAEMRQAPGLFFYVPAVRTSFSRAVFSAE